MAVMAMMPALMSGQAWMVVWLLLVLKLPIVYLGYVVWWAIRAEPEPPPARARVRLRGPCPWHPHRPRRRTRRIDVCHRARGRRNRSAEKLARTVAHG
jgi:hypothetical protein